MESIHNTQPQSRRRSVPKFLQGYGKSPEHGRHILPKAVNTPNKQYMIPLTKLLRANQQPHVRIDLHDVLRTSVLSKSEQSDQSEIRTDAQCRL